MVQRIYRILFLMFIVAGSLRLSAQAASSDVGVWLVGSSLAETTLVDEGDEIKVDFDENLGYGVSFNHFWTDAFSTEFAAQKFSADLILHAPVAAGGLTINAGDVDITSMTAMGQWHFRRATRFAPYIAGGIARISGEFDPIDDPDDPANSGAGDLESETTWAAAVGANVRITDSIFFVGELKYIPWSAVAKDDPTGDSLDIDPMTFSAGVKVRF
jgi:outer membrane protein W